MNLPNPFESVEFTDAERLEEAMNDGLNGAYQHATDENRMWYWLGYAAGVSRYEEVGRDDTDPSPKMTTIQVSEELKDELQERGGKGDTYEDVIWRLLKEWEDE